MRRLIAATSLAAAALAATAVPAGAMIPASPVTHTRFAVADNQGILYTRQHLTPGQIIHSGGAWYTVRSVKGDTFTVTPGLPAADRGKTVIFWT